MQSWEFTAAFAHVVSGMYKDKFRSQVELAAACGLGRSRVINYLQGIHEPSGSAFVAICDQLDIATDVMLAAMEQALASGEVTGAKPHRSVRDREDVALPGDAA